jgi:hypothetical protein
MNLMVHCNDGKKKIKMKVNINYCLNSKNALETKFDRLERMLTLWNS